MHHRAFRVSATRAFERAHIVARRMAAMRMSIIFITHFGHGGRVTARHDAWVRLDGGMTLPLLQAGALPDSQPPREQGPWPVINNRAPHQHKYRASFLSRLERLCAANAASAPWPR
jgi:hypothetical protein